MVLPAGTWYDWWTGERTAGEITIERPVDLATMPIYVRAGAIIPIDPVRQYTSQPAREPTTICVYPGANGRFRWYEDDGTSQEYLKGKFAWTNLTWDDASRRMAIERDTAAGTLEQAPRKLIVQLMPEGATKEIVYDGRRAEVGL